MPHSIVVKGVRVHNLKNLSLELPLYQFIVVTGVSGSGKSSLAFDTIYAEGQRRYIESMSTYARQFLEKIDKPDVDEIIGACPAIAIRQRGTSRNPRSTVGTVTEIHDFLRLLYARIGRTFCRQCGQEVLRDTPAIAADTILQWPEGTRFYILAPVPVVASPVKTRGRKKSDVKTLPVDLVSQLRQQGFTRLFAKGDVIDISAADTTLPSHLSELYILVDRLVVQAGLRKRLIDSLETAFRAGEGKTEIFILPVLSEKSTGDCAPGFAMATGNGRIDASRSSAVGAYMKFSEAFECRSCRIAYEAPEARLFSFNNAFGACPDCQGFGSTMSFDLNRVIPRPERSLYQGAIEPWKSSSFRSYYFNLCQFAQEKGLPLEAPFKSLSPEHQRWIIEGYDGFPGIAGFFADLEKLKYRMEIRIFISHYRGYNRCSSCNGERLRPEARAVRVNGKRIGEIGQMTIEAAAQFFDITDWSEGERQIADRILFEIRHRLHLLLRVGLDYLTLDRLAATLSGGEAQRIQLATALGSKLVGALYVLDEPSIGLHPRDTRRLIQILHSLRDLGNTVLVVEHDSDIIRAADHLIDLGPGAGEHGGRIVYQGLGSGIVDAPESLTGRYLRQTLQIIVPASRRKGNGKTLELMGVSAHNLKAIDVRIPLGMMVCVTGVSGSGKSTLVHDVLYKALQKSKGLTHEEPGAHRSRRGEHNVGDIVLVDQSPIGKSSRSNPVSYIGALDDIRHLFAATTEAQARGLTPGHFSFNVPGGRCEVCEGSGVVTVEMQFLADVELVCEECRGARFKSGILEIALRQKNIRQVLEMTVQEAMVFFADTPRLSRRLKVLDEVGLGYLRLGQSATTLSGGEAQRIKLASYLTGESPKNSLYIFDEPTTGLHLDDISKLLHSFDRLIKAGASIIIIEHNLEVIKTADWIIDLGPEGGERGGYVVATGTPEQVSQVAGSYTGEFLKMVLGHRHESSSSA
ncbi:MAG: excinuclease ABC subunit UvrA [Acidobacteria bacterium]|nr:excinuclease ABC subunit UvrA [Acidobacteriota bacterium]MBI3658329.1 excinuclease ABC subunit UvrA [Acidobacteriota bacterium]